MKNHPAILSEAGAHADWIAKPLIDAGCTLRHCTMRDVPAELATGKYNVLLLGRLYSLRRTKGEEEAAIAALRTALAEFLARGGGVFLALPVEGGVVDFTPVLDDFEARILELAVEQDEQVHSEDENQYYSSSVAYTDNVHPDFAGGVDGVWFPQRGCKASVTTRPVWGAKGAGWFPVLSALPESRTSTDLLLGHGGVAVDPNQPQFDRSVPLIQARQVSPGRLAVCGIPSGFHICTPHNYPLAKKFLTDGFDGKPSGLRQLLFNIWDWLGEPSANTLGGATTDPEVLRPQVPRFPDDPPVLWANPDIPRPPERARFGLIGARTVHSCGNGTVADYVARAKANGLDFIVFLEKFTMLHKNSLEQLKEECRAHCTDGFLAIPGYTIDDVAGNHFFQYGPDIVFPEDDLMDPVGERLGAAENATKRNQRMAALHCRFVFGTLGKGCRRGRYNYGDCPVIFEEHRFCDSTGLVTWYDGRVVDDQRDRYGLLLAQGMRNVPAVITLLDRPGDIDRALADGWRLGITEPYAHMPDKVLRKWMAPELEWWGMVDEKRMQEPTFRFGNWQSNVPFQSVTSGPEIHEWTASVTSRDPSWRAPDIEIPPTADPWRVDVIHFRLRLRVTAAAGIDRVVIYDGQRPVRRWDAGGETEFATELDLAHHQQMHLRLEAIDRNGGRALTSDYTTLRLDWCEFYCADRNNPLTIGFECGPDREAYGWSGTLYLTYGVGPWGGTSHGSAGGRLWRGGDNIYPVPCNPASDETAPTDGGVKSPGGGLHVWPLVPGEETLMVRCRQECISPDVAIDRIFHDRMFDPQWPWFFGRKDTGFGCFPSHPTRYFEMSRRARVFRPIPGLLTTLVYDYDLRWKETPPLTDPIIMGWLDEQVTHVLHRADGSTLELPGLDDQPFTTAWRRGEYIVSHEAGQRPAVFLNDGQDLELWRDTVTSPTESDGNTNPRGQRLCLRLDPTAIPGKLRFIAAGAPTGAAGPEAGERFCRDMGLTAPPNWAVDVRQGQLRAARLLLELDTEDGGTAWQWTAADLPAGLPVAVHGLNPHWSIFLIDLAAGKWRPLGVHDATAYLSLDPRRDWNVYVGHPVVADDERLTINLLQVADDCWYLEVHNPTGDTIRSLVRPVDAFTLADWDGDAIELPPGTSVTRRFPRQN